MPTIKSFKKPKNTAYHGKVPLLVREIRLRLTDGSFAPGQRLPTRTEFAAYYGISSLTVQRAMTQLIQDGFIESHGRKGSYVAAAPPHLTRYAVLFPDYRKDQWRSHLYNVIEHTCNDMDNPQRNFFFVSGYDTARGWHEVQKLVDDVRNERVAGLIFASDPFPLIDTPVLNTPALPRVAFMSHSITGLVNAVTTDFDAFIEKSIDYLEEYGCSRPALFFHSDVSSQLWRIFQQRITARGMVCHEHWVHGTRLDRPDWVRHIVRLLFTGGKSRPDSLIVADDNLLPAVSRELADSRIRVPEDVAVVAHANFPLPTHSDVPARRLGIDVHDFIETAVDIIGRIRCGDDDVPPKTVLPIVDESVMGNKYKENTV